MFILLSMGIQLPLHLFEGQGHFYQCKYVMAIFMILGVLYAKGYDCVIFIKTFGWLFHLLFVSYFHCSTIWLMPGNVGQRTWLLHDLALLWHGTTVLLGHLTPHFLSLYKLVFYQKRLPQNAAQWEVTNYATFFFFVYSPWSNIHYCDTLICLWPKVRWMMK